MPGAPAKTGDESVRVVVRCRPLSQQEIKQGHERIVDVDSRRGTLVVNHPNGESEAKSFTFDSVYGIDSKQRDLYDETFRGLVDSVLEGFNGTIFAYGQTGTGKTYTMEGVRSDPDQRGVIPNSFEHIFKHIAASTNEQYLVRASYLEIYQEEIRDLLNKDQTKRLELKERPDIGVYVKDLSSFVTKSVEEIEHVMSVGNANRKVGSTQMNEHSSRSHALFLVTVECAAPGLDGKAHIRVGRLNLVDLAGSERQAKTGATGERFKEATKINLSLSALGNVISALVDGKSSHIPYRDSKLTRLLQDSLGGNAKTVMVANVGPANYNYDETLSTLRYANRAKNIKNKPKINEDPKDALLREFQDEISKLKAMLEKRGGSAGSGKKRKKKKTTRIGENGESVTEEGEEMEGMDEEEWMKEQESRLEEERQAIVQNTHIIAEEKSKLLSGIEERASELEKRREAQRAMASKIAAMESKLLSGTGGSGSIAAHTSAQEAALEKQRMELAEQRRREREVLQELESQEESALDLHSTFTSLQQEVDVKTKKFKKMYNKMQQIKEEMADINSEHSSERRELEDTIAELTKELKLKVNIIENFVPTETRDRILERAYFDEDEDAWKLAPAYGPRPASRNSNNNEPKEEPKLEPKRRPVASNRRRPQCDFAKMGASIAAPNTPESFRFRDENILLLDLSAPPRTTKDYQGPEIAPGLSEALEEAMLEEEREKTIDISARRVLPKNGSAATPSAASRHRRAPKPMRV